MNRIKLNDVTVPEKLHIFLLEDDLIFQKRMIESLKAMGFRGNVTVAGSVAEAKAKVADIVPGFFLSDWNLPDGVGIDFLKFIRAQEKFDDVPYLMVTTMDAIDDILNAINLGADGYVVKPWDDSDLIEKMSFAVEKRQKAST